MINETRQMSALDRSIERDRISRSNELACGGILRDDKQVNKVRPGIPGGESKL